MQQYTGGCHCGKVRYEVTASLENVIVCNCSHCALHGLMLVFVPADQFTLLSGEDSLTEYRFNTKKIQHLFCSTCGVESFGRGHNKEGNPTVAINVRALDGVELEKLNTVPFDGLRLM